MADALGLRDRVALGAMRAVNAASRATRRGEGTVAGGRVALRLSPRLLERLSDGVELVLVSGTNGKTTTTACLAAAMSGTGDVATNATGSNMPPGHVAALGGRGPRRRAILESDEVWLPRVVDVERPRAVVLLNLSRDQLDRTSEVRQLAEGWRGALHGFEGWCVANADDPLVVSAVPEGGRVAWFAGGLAFRDDAAACPRCTAALEHGDGSWACPSCTLRRPVPHATADEHGAVVDGVAVDLVPALPGWFNRANALAALLCAVRLGVPADAAARRIAAVREVAGRFSTLGVGSATARLLLAKNPAGFGAMLDLVAPGAGPVVVAINARVADGLDPSWLYDVAFERLRGRRVVATGDRWRDLSARLFYADVPHECVAEPLAAVAAAGRAGGHVDVIANYTAFAELHRGA